MIVVDSSIWIDHLRSPIAQLSERLLANQILMHEYALGEVLPGSLRDRARTLALLCSLPAAPIADNISVRAIIEAERLFASGIGYVDAHLLASARMVRAGVLWTRDKRLHVVAERMGVAASLG